VKIQGEEMAILRIRKFPDPVLREKTQEVKKIDKNIKSLIKDMASTLYEAPGVGLAANQVGVVKKVVVIDIGDGLKVFINPKIIWRSRKMVEDEEACLSISPELHVPVLRHESIKFEAIDEKGRKVESSASGLLARIFQHEVDHLDGLLIIDRTTPEKRRELIEKCLSEETTSDLK
jgi:peptide deformylase